MCVPRRGNAPACPPAHSGADALPPPPPPSTPTHAFSRPLLFSDPEGAWNCSRPPAKSSGRDARSELLRFGHFYERAQNCALAAQAYAKAAPEVATAAAALEELRAATSAAWLDCAFLRDANRVAGACRGFLKWTFVRAFYLEDDAELALFADQQAMLEGTVERLGEKVALGALWALVEMLRADVAAGRVAAEAAGRAAAGEGGGAPAAAAAGNGGGGSGGAAGAGGSSSRKGGDCLQQLAQLRLDVLALSRAALNFMKNLGEPP